ncbi:MAG TPA: hypothetical protein DCZ01_11035 [Elusimicrobia bacterium]|nr:MAG: hypothetical protein A2X37_02025 [Elusimicrobia bacterium GWA2_66_18]HAZ09025.1 hypothetical protein [Elusimicrobiota bacterium]
MATRRRRGGGLRVLIAPNAFKGTLSGPAAARAMARGVREALPGAVCEELPIADGGDGLIDALRRRLGGSLAVAAVRGPRGERRRASLLMLPDGLAVVEMARASGLALVPPSRRDVLRASSRGTGDLIREAVRLGARSVAVGMGGSAASDAGAGMARALGARLLDAKEREVPEGAAALRLLARVDASRVRELLHGVRILALCDVTNPLCGPRGSARVFGPQKGATRAQVRVLEEALRNWAWVVERDLDARVEDVPGTGAAGGLGAGLLAFCRAELVPGADWVLEKLGAKEALARSDLALTGEGRLDLTSLYGKAPLAFARMARAARVPCAAVTGGLEPSARAPLKREGLARIVTFREAGARTEADAMKKAAQWAAKAASLAAAGLAAALLAVGARAAQSPSYGKLDAQYRQRDKDANLDDNIAALKAIPATADSLWRLCRAKVRRAEKREQKAEKLADYDSAREDCGKSIDLSASIAEAHFWHGVSMGRWGETKGLLKAMFLVKPIRREMFETLRLDPNHGGAHHILGEMLWQIPRFAGGDKKKALAEFETAVRLSPNRTAAYQPLAEAYLHFGRQADAVNILRSVEAVKEPADPAEYPENLADARRLLARLEGRR